MAVEGRVWLQRYNTKEFWESKILFYHICAHRYMTLSMHENYRNRTIKWMKFTICQIKIQFRTVFITLLLFLHLLLKTERSKCESLIGWVWSVTMPSLLKAGRGGLGLLLVSLTALSQSFIQLKLSFLKWEEFGGAGGSKDKCLLEYYNQYRGWRLGVVSWFN